MKTLKNIRPDYLIRAIVLIVVGIILAVWTAASLDVMARVLAVLLIVIGAVLIITYLVHKEKSFTISGGFVAGIIIAAVGAWIFANPGKFTDFIPKLFGIFILISGLSNLGQTVSLIRYKSTTWWISLIIAFVTVGLGAFLFFNPTNAKEIAVTLIGVFLIIDGVTNLITAVLVGSAAGRVQQEKEAIDVEAVVVEEHQEK
ncbi:hypothetical protein bpr_I2404 [Butyrivibrio proteoclasticus B316]|uniref:DUF308 domain-containing protein n=1 Tax=Butyrivibrio proteoclasticus (strain ATCC 51982 / DSM 14932 / B316) TaxID=515622 RepID=E0RZM1_BUTPB|nr:DUF308 domain-containing protein [Butyrivibrio proteoclasticus]ADL35137.1 hypothetical protein bpr_I2404 [Butyrivibrio proteoclasticus B316]